MKKNSKKISFLLLMTLLIQTFFYSSNMHYVSYGTSTPPAGKAAAGGDNGITVIQSVSTNNSGIVIPGDQPENEVTVELQYSTSSGVGHFHDVVLSYQLPIGTREGSIGWSRNANVVEEPTYDSGTRTVSWKLGNSISDPNILNAGISGNLELTFDFELPSAYPEDTPIELLPGIATWNSVLGDSSTQKQYVGNREFVQISLPPTWNIYKNGPSEVSISSNPSVTELYVDYDIILRDGNIDMRDVTITDFKPEHATFVSASISPQNVADKSTITSTTTSGAAVEIIALEEVPADVDTTISMRYAFPIIRNLGDVGILGGDTATNRVEVTGYPIITAEDASVSKHSTLVSFMKNKDEATTLFKDSTVKWGIQIEGETEYTLSSDVKVTTTSPLKYDISFLDGEIDLANVPVVFNIPADASVVNYTSDYAPVLDLTTKTITWTIDQLVVGNAPTLSVELEYPISRGGSVGVASGDDRDNKVTVNSVSFNPSTDFVNTKFKSSDSYWYAKKTGPSTVFIPHLLEAYTSPIRYILSLEPSVDTSSNTNENPPLEKVVLKDTLPAFAELVNATPGYTQNGSEITWTFNYNNIDTDTTNDFDINNPPSVFIELKYKIDRTSPFDGTDGIIPGSIMNNQLDITASYHEDYSGTPVAYPFGSHGTSTKTTTAAGSTVANPVIGINIENYSNDRHYTKDDIINYIITAYNTNTTAKDVRIELDSLPEDIDYTTFNTGVSNYTLPYTLEYKTKNRTTGIISSWNKHFDSMTNINTTIDVSTLLSADEELVAIRFIYKDDWAQDFRYDIKPSLSGTIITDNDVLNPNSVENIAKLYYKYQEFQKISDEKIKQDTVAFQILIESAWIRKLSKQKLTAGSSFYTSTPLDFRITLENDPLWATAGIENPIIIDYAPKSLDYIDNHKWSDTWMTDPLTKTLPLPEFKVINNYLNTGESVLIWGWGVDLDGDGIKAPDWTMPEGKKITIDYSMLIKSYAGNGTYSNKLYLQSSNRLESNLYTIENDILDIDKDLNTVEENAIGSSATFTVLETSALTSKKSVKGELNDHYTIHSETGSTTPGGASDYKLEIWNNGNVPMNNIQCIDIFPFEGDTGVIDGMPRNSEWRPYMVKAFDSVYEATVTSMDGVSYSVPVKIEYSTAKDPIRESANPSNGTLGLEEPNWSINPPEDITTVRALRFSIDDFSTHPSSDKNLGPGEKILIDWKMRTPVGAPTNDNIAWSSVAVKGTPKGKTKPLLWAEPNKVGIAVKSNPKGEIGNFVWFDQNKNGLQDDGYDKQNAGINGVKAILFKLDTGTGNFIPYAETITSFSHDGRPGFYSFPNLEIGDYYVVYELPSHYELSLSNQGNDDTIDSDAVRDGSIIKSHTIHINTNNSGIDKINNTLDVGLVPKNNLLEPSLTLTKEATHYKNNGSFIAFGSEKNINKNETIQYKIQVINNSSNSNGKGITLHNILLKDIITELNKTNQSILTFDSFTFTKVSSIDKNGHVIQAYDNMSNSPKVTDSNIVFDPNDSNKVIINELAVNEGYEFIGIFESTNAIVDNAPLINTVKVWANELIDKTDPTIPYDEKSAKVNVADMVIEKNTTHVKRKGKATFEVIPTGSNFGVEEGDTLRYEITVKNTGNVTLTKVRVDDPIANIHNKLIGSILVGKQAKVTGEYLVVRGTTDSIINTATASAQEIRFPVKDTHTAYFKGLSIQKSITAINGLPPVIVDGKNVVKVGDVIEYTMTFTNTDTKILKDVMITKDHLRSIKNTGVPENLLSNFLVTTTLNPSQSVSHSLEYTVKPTDITENKALAITNTVYGKSAGTAEKSATASAEIASLMIDKTANQSTYRSKGDKITYTITVKNNGTIDLPNVIVKDDMLKLDKTIHLLKAGEDQTFKLSYLITPQDIENNFIKNIASAETLLSGKVTDEIRINYTKKTNSSGNNGGGSNNYSSNDDNSNNSDSNNSDSNNNDSNNDNSNNNSGELDIPVTPQEPPIAPQPTPVVTPDTKTPVFVSEEGVTIIEIVEPPAQGTVTINKDGTIDYEPLGPEKKDDSFSIRIIDDGEERIVTITIPGEDLAEGRIVLPQTGEGIPFAHYIIGLIFIFIGLFQFKKKKILFKK